MRQALVALLVLILAGCRQSLPDQAAIAILLSSPPHPRLVTCLSVQRQDPHKDVLDALNSAGWRVVPLSTCSKREGHLYTASGERATLESLVLDNRSSVGQLVATSSSGGGMSFAEWRYYLRKVNGRWVIERSELVSMS